MVVDVVKRKLDEDRGWEVKGWYTKGGEVACGFSVSRFQSVKGSVCSGPCERR